MALASSNTKMQRMLLTSCLVSLPSSTSRESNECLSDFQSSVSYVSATLNSHLPPLTMILPDGSDFQGERLTVQFARGSRQRDPAGPERVAPRPRRTPYRMQISGLPGDTSWQVSNSIFVPVGPWDPFLLDALQYTLEP